MGWSVWQLANDESEKAGHGNDGEPAHPLGREPILLLAFVENNLERAEPHRQERKARKIDTFDFRVLDIGRVFDKGLDHEDGKDADGQVDIENPAPGIVVGDPATEGRPKNRGHNHAHAEGGHRHTALFARETFEQNRLRHRDQGPAARSLKNPGKDEKAERRSHAAQHGRGGKNADAHGQQAAPSELHSEPARDGQNDRIGNEIAGEHPGGLLGRGGEISRDVRQRHVRD